MPLARTALTLLLCLAVGGPALAADPPTADDLVARMIRAAGGGDAFASLGVLRFDVVEEETLSDGTVKKGSFIGYSDCGSLDSLRLELPQDVVLGKTARGAWAKVQGKVDDRPQSPRMAVGTLNSKLFPILLPFSLQSRGVELGAVSAAAFEGTPTWRLAVTFRPGFFNAPSMSGTWHVHAEQATGRYLTAEFVPPVEVRAVADEGVRYRPLKTTTVGGVTLPQQILLDGIDFSGRPNGHVRVSRVAAAVHTDYDPTLFMDPRQLEALDSGDVVPGPTS